MKRRTLDGAISYRETENRLSIYLWQIMEASEIKSSQQSQLCYKEVKATDNNLINYQPFSIFRSFETKSLAALGIDFNIRSIASINQLKVHNWSL